MTGRVEVRRIAVDDADALRSIRLAALLDAPSAFGSSHEAEVQQPPGFWTERAHRAATSGGSAYWFGERGDELVGLVGAFRPPDVAEDRVDLVSMWVAPDARRAGTGRLLVEAVVDWGRATGAEAIELWVTRGNVAAADLYRRCGFDETGDVAPLPSDPCRDEVRMRRSLRRSIG
ncbi:MAG: GNAT family N-acetyltransferase [Actinomycetota bacterium]